VIVRRGRIVPVLDVAPLLVGKSVSAQHFYLIAHCKIDQVTELSAIPVNGECELAAGDMQPPVDRPPYVAGTLQVADESLDVLDLEALVTSNVARSRESSGAEAQP
jgi:chemotaxis signal transduction protein